MLMINDLETWHETEITTYYIYNNYYTSIQLKDKGMAARAKKYTNKICIQG